MSSLCNTPIKLVDFAVSNARRAGFDPNQAEISLLWRIASGKGGKTELEGWTKRQTTGPEPFVKLPDISHSYTSAAQIEAIKEIVAALETFSLRLANIRAEVTGGGRDA